MTITDRVNMSLTLAPIRPWQEKWYEGTGYLAEIEAFYQHGAPGTENVRRTVESFFKACRELADWIEQSTGMKALAYVHSDANLKICDALVQVIKHHTRQNSALMTARISRIAGTSGGTTVVIAWRASSRASEQEVDALALAQRCVAAWELFFIQEGLTVSA